MAGYKCNSTTASEAWNLCNGSADINGTCRVHWRSLPVVLTCVLPKHARTPPPPACGRWHSKSIG
eukprot:2770514-Prorocentrum_lima.AAC.1